MPLEPPANRRGGRSVFGRWVLTASTALSRWAAASQDAERVGKAISTPARDAMLSHGTKEIGHGSGFGFHEAMVQAGAVLGPLLVAGNARFSVSFSNGGHTTGIIAQVTPVLVRYTYCNRRSRLRGDPAWVMEFAHYTNRPKNVGLMTPTWRRQCLPVGVFFLKSLYGETSSIRSLTNVPDANGARPGRHVADGRVVWRMLDGQSFRCAICHRHNASVSTWRRRSSSKWRRGIRRYAVGACRERTLRGRHECAGSHHERCNSASSVDDSASSCEFGDTWYGDEPTLSGNRIATWRSIVIGVVAVVVYQPVDGRVESAFCILPGQ